MRIPKEFSEALSRAYVDSDELTLLFKNHRNFISSLVRYALRFNHWGVISDEDDLFQEACLIIIDALWTWDEERSELDEYVVYQIGAYLKNKVMGELAKRRRPNNAPVPIVESEFGIERTHDTINSIREDRLTDPNSRDADLNLAIKRAIRHIESEPMLVRVVFHAMLEENGNVSAACRRVKLSGKVRGAQESPDAWRQHIIKNILPRIRTAFESEDIIQAERPGCKTV